MYNEKTLKDETENYLKVGHLRMPRKDREESGGAARGRHKPPVENRTISPEGIAELKIRLERLQSVVEKNSSEIAAVRSHTARLSEGRPLSAETFAGEMEKTRECLRQ